MEKCLTSKRTRFSGHIVLQLKSTGRRSDMIPKVSTPSSTTTMWKWETASSALAEVPVKKGPNCICNFINVDLWFVGVPVSTQWDVNGYYYPIQIAQFGLSHYSKYVLEDGQPTRIVLENGGDVRGKWITENSAQPRPVPDPENVDNSVIAIKAAKSKVEFYTLCY